MKKKGFILLTSTIVVGVLLGTINVSASQAKKNIPDAEQYERNYDSNQVVHDNVQPGDLSAFVTPAGHVVDGNFSTSSYALVVHDGKNARKVVGEPFGIKDNDSTAEFGR